MKHFRTSNGRCLFWYDARVGVFSGKTLYSGPHITIASGGALAWRFHEEAQVLDKIKIPAPPVLEGLSLAHGKVFVSFYDGSFLCFGKK